MGRIVLLGEPIAIDEFALAGATLMPAQDADSAHRAWAALPADVSVVILTASAAALLQAQIAGEHDAYLTVVMPS
jgi:hypothetical protein